MDSLCKSIAKLFVLAVIPYHEVQGLQNLRPGLAISEPLRVVGEANHGEPIKLGLGILAAPCGSLLPMELAPAFRSVGAGGCGLLFCADGTECLGCFVFHNGASVIPPLGFASGFFLPENDKGHRPADEANKV
jgi:hypothetical protein